MTKAKAELVATQLGAYEVYLKTRKIERDLEYAHSGAWHNRELTLHGISEHSVESAIETINHWRRQDPGCHMTINISSPGGGVFAGFQLYDVLNEVIAEGHPVTTRSYGYAASMGGILLQVGTTRQMSPFSYLMIHEVSSGVIGKVSELRDEVDLCEDLNNRALDILTSKSSMTVRQLKSKSARKDWWLSATEALKWGFIDEIYAPGSDD